MSESKEKTIGEWVSPDDLVPWERNPRVNDAAVEQVARSIERFGFASPILARAEDSRIIAGHTRLKAAKALKMDRVPVRFLHLSEEDASLLALADNRLGELADWDEAALAGILKELREEDAGIDGLGWDDSEIQDLIDSLEGPTEGLTDPDEIPEPPEEPITKTGDLWQLGDHRLLCGDSTKTEDVDRLMGGERASLCLTDPPYGLGGRKDSGKNDYDQHVDSQENLKILIDGWLPIAREMCRAVVFSPGVTNLWLYPEADWVMSWFYGGGPLRSPWGFNCWQPFLCYGKDPSLASGNGGRPDGVNMNTPANAKDINHPCPKPVALWEWFIQRLSFEKAELIFDPFAGSGTTVIVAEMTSKKCFGIELSPIYCDVIIKRWENYTGKEAVLMSDGGADAEG